MERETHAGFRRIFVGKRWRRAGASSDNEDVGERTDPAKDGRSSPSIPVASREGPLTGRGGGQGSALSFPLPLGSGPIHARQKPSRPAVDPYRTPFGAVQDQRAAVGPFPFRTPQNASGECATTLSNGRRGPEGAGRDTPSRGGIKPHHLAAFDPLLIGSGSSDEATRPRVRKKSIECCRSFG